MTLHIRIALRSCAATIALLAIATPVALSAQVAYARPTTDTLRFHEVTSTEITLQGPQGEMQLEATHDAIIGIRFLGGDSAIAWYDTVAISLDTPQGTQRPSMTTLVGKPFRLRFDPRGGVRVLSAPALTPEIRSVSDLTRQFDDFFPRLPRTDLTVGKAWSDTVVNVDSANNSTFRRKAIARYRVLRDTTVGNERAFIVGMTQDLELALSQAQPGLPVVDSKLTGGDEGSFVFAPRSGRLLARQRKGTLSGRMTMQMPAGSMSMRQSFSYENRVGAVR